MFHKFSKIFTIFSHFLPEYRVPFLVTNYNRMSGILLFGEDGLYYLEVETGIYGPYATEQGAVDAYNCGNLNKEPCSQSLLDYRLLRSLY